MSDQGATDRLALERVGGKDAAPREADGLAAFSRLLVVLEQAEGTRARQQALIDYLRSAASADRADAAWAVWLLSGERIKRVVPLATLKAAAIEVSGLPAWAFEECYQTVGDLAETIALLVAQPLGQPNRGGAASATGQDRETDASKGQLGLARWITERILGLRGAEAADAMTAIAGWWAQLPSDQIFCLNKLMTGGLRVGVSRGMVVAALSAMSGLPRETLSMRLMRLSSALPCAEDYVALLQPVTEADGCAGPLPFFLAQSLSLPETLVEDPQRSQALLTDRLGPATDWVVEWKWDGIRAQAVVGPEGVQLWSRGEEIVNAMFPELVVACAELFAHTGQPCLLDGEILVWQQPKAGLEAEMPPGRSPGRSFGRPLPFSALQTRLGRKRPSAKIQSEAPVVFMAYDLLRLADRDLRPQPFLARRAALEALLEKGGLDHRIRLSQICAPQSWQEVLGLRSQADQSGTEGLMLKHRTAAYGQGRQKKTAQGEVWKWKRDPMSVDAVLVYAQRGHGRRAGLYTDYGFALWDDRVDPPALVPFAKAYSGLTDAEIRQVDQVIRKTILEKFGPVRQVMPQLVMELGFEGVMPSRRHKSGFAVRFPRILRLRPDKPIDQADRLSALAAFLQAAPESGFDD